MTPRPHVILTLRRTGGTTLTTLLQAISPFPKVQHEPLNPGRAWGTISRAFSESGDLEAVQTALAAKLARRPNIKHCIETVPPHVTRLLIEACAERDYAVFLLTRRNEASRIRSLFLAQATGAWGARQAAEIYPRILSSEIRLAPVRLKSVEQRLAKDAAALGQVLRFLRHRRIDHDWLLFEEIYADDGAMGPRIRAIAARTGIDLATDDPRLQDLAVGAGQRSGDILPFLPNSRDLDRLLDTLCVV